MTKGKLLAVEISYGLLGLNGAEKNSVIKILATLLRPTSRCCTPPRT